MRKGLEARVPPDYLDFLAHAHKLNLQRNRLILAQIKELARLLEKAGVACLFLKGAACLADDLFGGLGGRMMKDIDVLIDAEDLPVAVTALARAGYACQGVPDWQAKECPPFQRDGEVALVDLHRWLGDQVELVDSQEVMASKQIVCVDGVEIGVPSPAHRAFQSWFHAQYEDLALDLFRLPVTALVDYAYLAERYGDAVIDDDLERRSARFGLGAPASIHRQASEQIIGASGSGITLWGRLHVQLCLWVRGVDWLEHGLLFRAGMFQSFRRFSIIKRYHCDNHWFSLSLYRAKRLGQILGKSLTGGGRSFQSKISSGADDCPQALA